MFQSVHVDSLAAAGAKEVVLFHDDCYSALVDTAPSIGVSVPFRPLHVVEYLRDYPLLMPKQIEKPADPYTDPAGMPIARRILPRPQ